MQNQKCLSSVLIESDWNLKRDKTATLTYTIKVLIESDWNLKQRDGTLLLIR